MTNWLLVGLLVLAGCGRPVRDAGMIPPVVAYVTRLCGDNDDFGKPCGRPGIICDKGYRVVGDPPYCLADNMADLQGQWIEEQQQSLSPGNASK